MLFFWPVNCVKHTEMHKMAPSRCHQTPARFVRPDPAVWLCCSGGCTGCPLAFPWGQARAGLGDSWQPAEPAPSLLRCPRPRILCSGAQCRDVSLLRAHCTVDHKLLDGSKEQEILSFQKRSYKNALGDVVNTLWEKIWFLMPQKPPE